jgi:NAD(P)-dependent dehydrogenase (short-subunit alcohol dehydrogenase family)
VVGIVSQALELSGETLVVIGGSSGIGLETARCARAEGAGVIITARDPDRLHAAGLELGGSIAAFDATDFERLERFFDELPAPVEHVLLAGPDPRGAALRVARKAGSKLRPGGTLLFIGCADGDHPAELAALTKNLARDMAPVRVNLIVAGFRDTPLSTRRDIAALAVHLMTNAAITGASFEIDGSRQLVRA